MAAGSVQYTFASSYGGFWPVGDVYSMEPKWRELHTDTDRTVDQSEEANRLELVGDLGASDIFFVIQLRDLSDPDNPQAPSEEPEIQDVVRLGRDGWNRTFIFDKEFVYETPEPVDEFDEPEPVWTGDIKLRVTPEMQASMGEGQIADFTIDAVFPSDIPERRRVAYGTLVLRG